ncbi:LysR family transcriptional regulator [Terasakiella sp. A23]|uniref:LysR family transcriptional regulator n=1 Tax=Terasakiella sp. FCG-A23 TaxID=3080561 RepID=UPI002955C34B|nr:LysR family transcriptional regulator [Terasakiella sp. A23]MDV7339178.1 LysR family transcriptional regulator [Terasakiella sp. A23]
MRLKNLETFLAIVKLGSFSAAAEKLHTTQPSISNRITQLEEELGVALFHRAKGKMVLAPKGWELVPYAERMIELNHELCQKIASPTSLAGVVRLGTSETLVHTWVPDLLKQLQDDYPNLVVEMEVDTTISLRNSLTKRELDIAFLMGPVSEPTMLNQHLDRYQVFWAAHPDLGLGGRPLTLHEIAEHPILCYPRQTRPYVALRESLRKAGISDARIMTSGSLATIIHLVATGGGVACLPKEVLQIHYSAGNLEFLDVEMTLPELDFTVTYPQGTTNPLLSIIADKALEVAENRDHYK